MNYIVTINSSWSQIPKKKYYSYINKLRIYCKILEGKKSKREISKFFQRKFWFINCN